MKNVPYLMCESSILFSGYLYVTTIRSLPVDTVTAESAFCFKHCLNSFELQKLFLCRYIFIFKATVSCWPWQPVYIPDFALMLITLHSTLIYHYFTTCLFIEQCSFLADWDKTNRDFVCKV